MDHVAIDLGGRESQICVGFRPMRVARPIPRSQVRCGAANPAPFGLV